MAALDRLAALFAPFPGEDRATVLTATPEIARGEGMLEALRTWLTTPGMPLDEALVVGAPQTPEDRLRFAMENLREIEVQYTRALDGHTGTYRLRPYELGYHPMSGRPVLWAQADEGFGARPLHASDPSTGGLHLDTIHAFREDGLAWDSLRVTEAVFSPEWPVQPDTVP